MALHKLVEGECGGPSPLMRLTSHLIQDYGLKEEGLYDFYKTSESFQSGDSEGLVKQFLEETSGHPQTFKMDSLLQEMRDIDQSVYTPATAPNVVQESGQDSAWANQYIQSGKHFDEKLADNIWNSSSLFNVQANPLAGGSSPGEVHEFGLGPKWAEEYLENAENVLDNDKISQLAVGLTSEQPNAAYSKFMKFMHQEGKIEESVSGPLKKVHDKWTKEFIQEDKVDVKDEKTEQDDAGKEQELAVAGTWIDEFIKTSSADNDYESSLWSKLQEEWSKAASSDNISTTHPWISEYETFYDPFKEYKFNEENPMKELSDAFEEGTKRLEKGDLAGAVLCFEAAVQQDETNAQAWLMLGKTQAENEQDPLAISALKQCLVLDPSNNQALMALAVSYTNESYQSQACLTLKEWLTKNDNYKHLVPLSSIKSQPANEVSSILFRDAHEEVKDLFIQAARLQPRDAIDPDVQCGLGVLFNLSSEYDKAADCFRAALVVRQNDPKLWNRLGATLANGQRSAEAIDAYHHALELSPGYIRARYNLGISCINLNAYKEAGEHLLTALNQQASARGVHGENAPPAAMSNTIWSTLRLVVSLMHKYHLNKAIENRDLATLNKEFEME